MTFDEMMEELKKDPECRETIEKAELIANFLFENDYVEVVRCEDCLHYSPTSKGYGLCIKDNRQCLVHDHFFCFYGERDEDWDYEKEGS